MFGHISMNLSTHVERRFGHLVGDDGEVDGEGEEDGDGGAHLLPGVCGQREDQRGGAGQDCT